MLHQKALRFSASQWQAQNITAFKACFPQARGGEGQYWCCLPSKDMASALRLAASQRSARSAGAQAALAIGSRKVADHGCNICKTIGYEAESEVV